MSKIPTAEEFLKSQDCQKISDTAWTWVTKNDLIEFAKLHVEAALKEASEKVELDGDEGSNFDYISVNENSILNAYPLENIK